MSNKYTISKANNAFARLRNMFPLIFESMHDCATYLFSVNLYFQHFIYSMHVVIIVKICVGTYVLSTYAHSSSYECRMIIHT